MSKVLPIPELQAVQDAIHRAQTEQRKGWDTICSQESWEIYTDGSAPIKNPGGAIGFSAVFLTPEGAWEVYGGTPGRKSEPATSNNRAEISGVLTILEVLYLCQQNGNELPDNIVVVCDSQYVVNCAQGKWKKHKNKDLWRRFDQLMCIARREKVKVKFQWTRAHVGTEWNERADVLAKDGAFLAIGKKAPGESDTNGKAKETDASGDPSIDCQYLLRLYSEMDGSNSARSLYSLATANRNRTMELELEAIKTLDEAEYQGLIHGLQDLVSTLEKAGRDPSEFSVAVDSCRDLMLKQLQGTYGVKSERLQPLHRKATSLASKFATVQWSKSSKAECKEALDR